MAKAEFIAEVWPVIKAAVAAPGAYIVMAHAVHESGWGISKPAREGFNYFNITRLPTDPAPIIRAPDLEFDVAGKKRKIVQRFAKYASPTEAIAHYLKFIGRKRYEPALACLAAGDVAGFVSALKLGGYFTSPLAEYLEGMSRLHDQLKQELKDG